MMSQQISQTTPSSASARMEAQFARRYTSAVPISSQILLSQVDYSAWANQLLLSACSTLTPEELDRDLKASHSSILRTLRHIYYAERVWLKRLQADALPPGIEIGNQQLFRDPDPEPDLQQLQQAWPSVSEGLHKYVESLSEAEITGEIRGIDCAILRWKLLLHMVNHSTLHRGQVASMLRQLGKQPPNTDLFSYYFPRP
jgi:uncharacterized damage-inducible protein DinB